MLPKRFAGLDLIVLNNCAVWAGIPLLGSSVATSVGVTGRDGRWIVGSSCGSTRPKDRLGIVQADESGVKVCGDAERENSERTLNGKVVKIDLNERENLRGSQEGNKDG